MRTIFRDEQVHELPAADTDDARYAAMTLSQAVTGYVLATLVVAGAFGRLAWARRSRSRTVGARASFWDPVRGGRHFTARGRGVDRRSAIGGLDMAPGNPINIVIQAVDDLAYTPGLLLSAVDPTLAVSALFAMVMSGIAIVGLFCRAPRRLFRTVGWASLFLLIVLYNSYTLYLYGP